MNRTPLSEKLNKPISAYLRKSRAEEHLDITEVLDNHLHELRKTANRHGLLLEEADIYKEVVSGESLYTRPQMLRLLEAVEQGRYSAVLCVDMQRLGRGGMSDQGIILDTFKYSNTIIVTPDRIYDLTEEFDEEAAEFQAMISRREYKLITKRMRRGLRITAEKGGYIANAPFGYKKTIKDKLPTLEPDPDEAPIVKMIYDRYISGEGCTKISAALEELGIHGKRGASFNRNTIRNILLNPVYIGKILWNNNVTVKTGSGANMKKTTAKASEEQRVFVKGNHPPLIEETDFEHVAQIMADKGAQMGNSRNPRNPFAGLVYCAACGNRLQTLKDKKVGDYLICTKKGCSAGAKLEYFEDAAINQLCNRLVELETGLAEYEPPDTTAQENALNVARNELKKVTERKERLLGFLEDGTLETGVYKQRMTKARADEDLIMETIKDLQTEISAAGLENKQIQYELLATATQAYYTSDVAGKNRLLKAIVNRIDYTKMKKTKPADFTLNISLRDFV